MIVPLLEALATVPYSPQQVAGVTALVVAGFTSLVAILFLAVVMMIKCYQASRQGGGFLQQTHVAPYFVSLLAANLIQSIGSVLNMEWLQQGGTIFEPSCVVQGIAKNIGNVGTSFWSLIIAFHAFDLLFLRRKQHKLTLWATIIATWVFTLCVDSFGSIFLQNEADGPFFGVSGYWCWITSNYPRSRIFTEYMFMFVAAFLCAILHTVVFLRLRGNLSGEGWRNIRFRRIPRSERWVLKVARDEVDNRMFKVATQLMWYPLVYTLVIIPIAVARFVDFAGYDVPFWLTITADFFFNLNGLLNVVLFAITYRRIPVNNIPSLSTKRKSIHVTNYGITPFVFPEESPENKESPSDPDLEKGEGVNHRASVSTMDSSFSTDSKAHLIE